MPAESREIPGFGTAHRSFSLQGCQNKEPRAAAVGLTSLYHEKLLLRTGAHHFLIAVGLDPFPNTG